MSITFINAMVVPEAQESRFLEYWDKGAAYVASQPGFISTSLHKNLHRGAFQYYTVACWDSEEAFRTATSSEWWSDFTREFGFGNEVFGLEANPALCEVLRDEQGRYT